MQGSGRQFVPWIHEADYARAVEFLIAREDLAGPFNFVAPNPCPTASSWPRCAKLLICPTASPPRRWQSARRMAAGNERGVGAGQLPRHPGRLLEVGFDFQFPDWPEAAEDLVRQWEHRND